MPILAKWPVANFSNFEDNFKKYVRKIPNLSNVEPILLARMIRNICMKWKVFERRLNFEFPAYYGDDEIAIFTSELAFNGPYPIHFTALPKITAQMINTLVVDDGLPSHCKGIVGIMVKQIKEDRASLMGVLLEQYFCAKYHQVVIDQLIPGKLLEQAIMELLPVDGDLYGKKINTQCARFIVHHVLHSEPNMNLAVLADKVSKYVLPEAFLACRSANELNLILSAALRMKNGSLDMLDKTVLDALCALMKKKYTIKTEFEEEN